MTEGLKKIATKIFRFNALVIIGFRAVMVNTKIARSISKDFRPVLVNDVIFFNILTNSWNSSWHYSSFTNLLN